jgi:sucrose-6-phosphate hydrolase SacC (GH32 family)
MFQLKDTVHLFFQYNPRDLAWGEGSSCSRFSVKHEQQEPCHIPFLQSAVALP